MKNKLIIATLKEIKIGEGRVALTPYNVKILVKNNHKVLIQSQAGINSGFSDIDYKNAGAILIKNALEIVKNADILIKVKEPIPKEYVLLDNFKKKILFCYLHLSAVPKELTKRLLKNKITAIGYETIGDDLPLLKPMSEIAGILAVQYGAQYLQKRYQGRGITLGFIKGINQAEVVVIGGGTVGAKAALTAAGLGAKVTVIELRKDKIKRLKQEFKKFLGENLFKNLTFLESTSENIKKAVKKADLLIGAVLVPGKKAPLVVTKAMVEKMKKGAVIIDVAIDQGGCIYGSKPTTHDNPIYYFKEKIYCCIPNMPGQVPLQATLALTNATFPYLLKLANDGLKALKADPGFLKGVNTHNGKITLRAVAESLNMLDYYKELIL